MPTNNEGLDQVEAVVSSDNSTNNAASSAGSVSADRLRAAVVEVAAWCVA